jgi:Zn-dependent peptidase ImmA (M78 family)
MTLAMGYIWDPELGEIGDAILSSRDGKDNPVWSVTLNPNDGESATDITWAPVPPELPQLDLSEIVDEDESSDGRRIMTRVGDVILTARRAAGLTQEDLAARLGITQAALSRYENDLREPDDDAVARISEELDVSPEFLTHAFQLTGAIAADAHMRRQKTTKVSDWKAAEAKLKLYRMRSKFLMRCVPINPANHIPTFDPDDTTPADAAKLVRAQWRMPIGPVRNLTRWVESAGVIVIEEHLGTKRIDGLSQRASDYPVLLLNADLANDRKRWTLAHELGHVVLHSSYFDPDVEAQEDAFAAEFLMPAMSSNPTCATSPRLD